MAAITSVWVDFNDREHGLVPAWFEDASGGLPVGESVYAWDEFEEGLRAPAVVVERDETRGCALLEVDWDRVERDDTSAPNAHPSDPTPLYIGSIPLQEVSWRGTSGPRLEPAA